MEQIKEAVYLINDERYLHLRENGTGVGFATYNKVTGEPLESGQISEKNLPPDGQNTIPAARNWYLFELSDDDRKAIQQESVKILENIPQAGIGRRRIWEPETLPKDIRLINSHYDDLYRIPDGGVIQVDYPDGRSFTARVEHLDDYHFDMGGLGNVFHICQFAEVMERNHADFSIGAFVYHHRSYHGLPLGIWSANSKRCDKILHPILDLMQTMPAFVYLIPAVLFFGLGTVPGAFATIIFAMPPVVRLTSLGIKQVPKNVVEASRSFGATPMQLLFKVQLPLALPTIMTGINQTILMSLSMVVIAAMIAAGGLGEIVLKGITQMKIGLGFEGGIAVVILAIILDRITQGLGKQKKGK